MKRKVLIFGLCLLEVTCALSAKDKKSIPLYKDAKAPGWKNGLMICCHA